MRWAVLVALLLVSLGAYSLMRSARDLGMAVRADTSEQIGAGTTPRLLERDVPVRQGMAMLELACEGATGCHGVVTIALDNDATASAPYALPGGRTSRYALPLPPGTRATRGELTWLETSGASSANRIRLRRP
jgi:hypothetical protein